jgi:hypothetical protein
MNKSKLNADKKAKSRARGYLKKDKSKKIKDKPVGFVLRFACLQ